MTIKRLLVFLPLLVTVILLQSYFWVPTFSDQVKGSDRRLSQYISGSIGDAQILNPILHADTTSGAIVDQVFDGLIDRDKNLRFRGRLATSWRIYEETFFAPRPDGPTAEALRDLIRAAVSAKSVPWANEVTGVEIAAAASEKVSIFLPPAKKGQKPRREAVTFAYPARVKVTLKSVEQDFFKKLIILLGQDAFADDPAPYLPEGLDERVKKAALGRVNLTEHNPVIIFKLRQDVRFHDGHEFDSGDVRFTYESIMNPRNLSPRVPDFEPIKTVETPARFTVKVTYKRLYSPAFGTWRMQILPEHLLNKKALEAEARSLGRDLKKFTMRDSGFNRSPLGTGAFKFKEWQSDELIRLVRNDDYWEGPAKYNEYIMRIIPDPLTQEMAFYAGTVDSYGAGTHQVERLRNDPRFQVFSGLSFGFTYIGYNLRREPFKDVRVRRALSMAVDTRKIHKFVLYGEAENITGPFVKQSEHYNKLVKPLPHDPKGAERLLHEAGWKKTGGKLVKDGKQLAFKLVTNNGNESRKAISQVVQDAWKRIGVKVSLDRVEWAVFLQKYINALNFDAVILGWRLGLDPDLYQIWHSSQTNPHQLNFVGYKNSKADDLIIKIRQEYDLKKQVGFAHRLHEVIYRDQPYTFLYVGKWTALLDTKIVVAEKGAGGKSSYRKIHPTPTGNYTYDFRKWLKLPVNPRFEG